MSSRCDSAWMSFSANSSVPYFSHGRLDGTLPPPPITRSS